MNLWLRIYLPFAAGYFLSYLLRNVNGLISPELVRDLNISAADLGLVTAAYLLAFGAFQLPLGMLLDRYGPRRVESALLLIAAIGCVAFATGSNLTELVLARALIGLGVSSCLMASFKAAAQWFAPSRLPSVNAAVMAAGGLGALTATTPLSWVLPQLGWRGVFWGLCLLALLAALGIFSTPEKPQAAARVEPLREQLATLGGILRSRVFWRFAPQTALIIGGFMALQGLWAAPWLLTVSRLSRAETAFHLLCASAAMLVGFTAIALFIGPLARRGVSPLRVLQTGMGLGVAVLLLIVLDVADPDWSPVLWFAYGLVFAVGNLAYAELSAHFSPQVLGRVNTALNLAAFVGAFSLQWGIGALLDGLQLAGLSAAAALRLAFSLLLGLQALAWGWFVWAGRKTGLAQS